MTPRLRRVDKLTLPEHPHLTVEDECYFYGEYTAYKGWRYSGTNSLIYNLKKGVDKRDRPDWRYKGEAIQKAANDLRGAISDEFLTAAVLVPVPPSKAKSDPGYDDRMLQILQRMTQGLRADIRELVIQRETTEAAHSRDRRLTPFQLRQLYDLREELLEPKPNVVALVDDVLTTGCHFKAAQGLIHEHIPDLRVVGIFVARRVPEPG